MNSETPDGWVRTSRDDAVLTVTLDRADQLNAQTPATWEALAAIGRALEDDGQSLLMRPLLNYTDYNLDVVREMISAPNSLARVILVERCFGPDLSAVI